MLPPSFHLRQRLSVRFRSIKVAEEVAAAAAAAATVAAAAVADGGVPGDHSSSDRGLCVPSCNSSSDRAGGLSMRPVPAGLDLRGMLRRHFEAIDKANKASLGSRARAAADT
eukprot:SAG22_NODE_10196_length_548_cov_0.910913_1_plen_112_part_00